MSLARFRVLKCGRISPPARPAPFSRSAKSSAIAAKSASGGRLSKGAFTGVISARRGVEAPVPRGSNPITS